MTSATGPSTDPDDGSGDAAVLHPSLRGEGAIRFAALFAGLLSGELALSVPDRFAWVEKIRLLDCELSPADIPIARKLAAGGV